ncbi:MAG: hypothetical protein IPN03_08295 [Holophagales bacterium]|nr:hypothetical protein [Holophagales bacterium]
MLSLAVSVALCIGAAGAIEDPCAQAGPASLWRAVQAQYSTYRLNSLSDLSEHERKLYESENAGSCPGVAKADFFGDKVTSYALILRSGKEAIVITARHAARGWQLVEVDRIPDGSVSAVFAEPKGTFEDVATGERRSSKHAVVHVVKYESSSIVYILEDSAFHPVFLKD